jgi:hypothetical protein
VAYFLFVDESGHDQQASPYEVLAGVAVEEHDFWNLVQAIQQAEVVHFGARYSHGPRELKAKKLLKRKTFRLAQLEEPIAEEERTALAQECLEAGASATPRHLAALAQAKLAFVERVFDLCADFRIKAFALIVKKGARRPAAENMLRRDYAFFFERFFYFLEDVSPTTLGVIVFDELEKSRSHLLVSQMDSYFKDTERGRQRAGRIIPEPFFVHSDLTTGIQIADLIAYLLSWGFRDIKEMVQPRRPELDGFVRQVCRLRHRSVRNLQGKADFGIWSFHYITDLRPKSERRCG